MTPASLRASTLALLTCTAVATAQAATAKSAVSAAPAAASAGQADAADTDGLPTFLLPVPAGTVELGLDAAAFLQAARQAALPNRPDQAHKIAPAQLATALRRSTSVLGRRKVDVPAFLLGRTPVTNAQYEAFVAMRRKDGGKYHVPFHWWRFGRSDDYDQKLEEINKLFPKSQTGPLDYWERFGGELPGALKDQKGNPIGNNPVTFVSFRAANEFAASLGMRLPTEPEWTRAARGAGKAMWPLAKPDDPASDRYTEQLLKDLRMFTTADKANKPCGAVQAATGPFGHTDMFGQVWQLVSEIGYRPINGREAFEVEWKNLMKDKSGDLVKAPPTWRDELVVAKGGSYLSNQEPIQLLIDARAPMQTIDVMEGLGFRLAKSMRPGYDALFSMLRGSFHKGAFAIDQTVDLGGQVGCERYELDPAGNVTAYAALSFAPVNWLAKEKAAEVGKLLDQSMASPLLIGALMSTMPMSTPAAPAGLYSVLYRKAGLPRELVDAVKLGHKELVAAKAKGDKAKPEDKANPEEADEDKKQDKKKPWREVVERFGVTDEELLDKSAADGTLKAVRIDGCVVPTTEDCFLLHGNDGKVVAAWPAPNAKPAFAALAVNGMTVTANAKGRFAARIRAGVPLSLGVAKKFADVQIGVVLDCEAPTEAKPWRLPPAADR
jgi:formylglycine-generating enzyme required for sulfatase activity